MIVLKKVEAWIELKEEYSSGLKDLDEFSHAILIYYFHNPMRNNFKAVLFWKTRNMEYLP